MDIEGRFYHFGLGMGIPYEALNAAANAMDETRHASDLKKRRSLAREMLEGSKWTGYIPSHKGYALVRPDTLPGSGQALAAAREIINDRRKTGWKARPHNPFYQLERQEDFRDYPDLIDFVLSEAVLHIVSDYYGMVPQLKEVGIWLTQPHKNKSEFSSQLYHLDKPESRLVKLFLSIEENSEDTGPLTLLPLNVSEVVRQNTGYEAIYFRGDGRLTDEEVFANCSTDDEIMLGTEKGGGGFADTSNCFHFGSRCLSGERQILMLSFMLPHKARKRRTPLFDLVREPADEIHRLVLSGAHFQRP